MGSLDFYSIPVCIINILCICSKSLIEGKIAFLFDLETLALVLSAQLFFRSITVSAKFITINKALFFPINKCTDEDCAFQCTSPLPVLSASWVKVKNS